MKCCRAADFLFRPTNLLQLSETSLFGVMMSNHHDFNSFFIENKKNVKNNHSHSSLIISQHLLNNCKVILFAISCSPGKYMTI